MEPRNVVLCVLKGLHRIKDKPDAKDFTNVMFLLEKKGLIELGDYKMHFYGVSSEKLNRIACELFDLEIDSPDGCCEEVDEVISYLSGINLDLLVTALYMRDYCEGVFAGVRKLRGERYSYTEFREILKHFEYFGREGTAY